MIAKSLCALQINIYLSPCDFKKIHFDLLKIIWCALKYYLVGSNLLGVKLQMVSFDVIFLKYSFNIKITLK